MEKRGFQRHHRRSINSEASPPALTGTGWRTHPNKHRWAPSPRLTVRSRLATITAALVSAALFSAAGCVPVSPSPTTTTVKPTSNFTIDIRFLGTPTTTMRSQIQSSVDWWETALIGDVPSTQITATAGSCLKASPAVNRTVDDMMLDVEIVAIDGVGGVLGQAGPCWVRSSDGLTSWGILRIDLADAGEMLKVGRFDDVIRHEVGHTLGFGTLWESTKPLVVRSSSGAIGFKGTAALTEWRNLGGSGTTVPIETAGGPGTAGCHWSETAFGVEMMTGYLDTANPISRVTIASMKDLGYGVNLAVADSYSLPRTSASRVSANESSSGEVATTEAGTEPTEHDFELDHNAPIRIVK